MLKEYVLCLCFGFERCKTQTEEIAKRNNAVDWLVEPVFAPPVHGISYGPIVQQIAYRGKIVIEEM